VTSVLETNEAAHPNLLSPGRGPVPPRTTWSIWLQAVRPFSFTASIVPILVASALAYADDTFQFSLALLMLIASVACHAGSNLANDYNDHIRGVDTAASLGPSLVIQQGHLSPAAVRRGMFVAFAIAICLGLIVVSRSGVIILMLALLSLAAAYLYTGGPRPLAYIALGEVTVFFAMGVGMVVGAYIVMAGEVTPQAFLVSIPIASLVAAILHANNIRDIELDLTGAKRTLANQFGRRFANREYAVLVVAAYVATALLIATSVDLWPSVLVILSLPLAIRLIRLARRATEPQALNALLRQTAGLHLRFGLLLTLGLICSRFIDR